MTKQKWYQSKGGWIWVGLVWVLYALFSTTQPIRLIDAALNSLTFNNSINIGNFVISYKRIILLSLGFTIGYFIEKKFFSKKRYSISGRRGRR